MEKSSSVRYTGHALDWTQSHDATDGKHAESREYAQNRQIECQWSHYLVQAESIFGSLHV